MRTSPKSSLFLDQSCGPEDVVTPEDTSSFTIDPDGEITPPAEFTYNGHQVEILPSDKEHLIGNYRWERCCCADASACLAFE
jgi:hypothetical protein